MPGHHMDVLTMPGPPGRAWGVDKTYFKSFSELAVASSRTHYSSFHFLCHFPTLPLMSEFYPNINFCFFLGHRLPYHALIRAIGYSLNRGVICGIIWGSRIMGFWRKDTKGSDYSSTSWCTT